MHSILGNTSLHVELPCCPMTTCITEPLTLHCPLNTFIARCCSILICITKPETQCNHCTIPQDLFLKYVSCNVSLWVCTSSRASVNHSIGFPLNGDNTVGVVLNEISMSAIRMELLV